MNRHLVLARAAIGGTRDVNHPFLGELVAIPLKGCQEGLWWVEMSVLGLDIEWLVFWRMKC